jgi:hypothetical protein
MPVVCANCEQLKDELLILQDAFAIRKGLTMTFYDGGRTCRRYSVDLSDIGTPENPTDFARRYLLPMLAGLRGQVVG